MDRGNELEDHCASLEDRLLQVIEEAKTEWLKAVDAVCTKYEDTLLQQVQELQHQLQQLQSCSNVGAGGEQVPDKTVPGETGLAGKSGIYSRVGETTKSGSKATTTTSCTPNITTDDSRSDKGDHKDGNVPGTGAKVTDAPKTNSGSNPDFTSALLAQQLLPLCKHSGNSDSPMEDTFQEWIVQFELVAEVCKWSPQEQHRVSS